MKEFRTSVPHAKWTHQFPVKSNGNMNEIYKIDVRVGQWYLFFAYPMATSSLIVNITGIVFYVKFKLISFYQN